MLDRLRGVLEGSEQTETDLLQQRIKQLERQLQELQWRQQKLDRTVDKTRRIRPQIQDIAIEEKVDTSRIVDRLEQLQADAASTDQVREQLALVSERVKEREDALKADLTVMDTAIHNTVEAMRQDLVDGFRKEFLALETVLTYEMDAVQAQDRWAREDLKDHITALRHAVEEDVTELETETVAMLQANTAMLQNQLEDREEQLETEQAVMEQRIDAKMDALEQQVQRQINALPDATEIVNPSESPEEATDDTHEATKNVAVKDVRDRLASLEDRLKQQRNMAKRAREDLQHSIDAALDAVQEDQIRPLHEAIEETRQELDGQISRLADSVQQDIERLSRQETADIMALEDRLDLLERRLDQELAASETVQDVRLQNVQDALAHRISGQDEQLTAVQERITVIDNRITGLRTALSTLQEQTAELAAADDLDTVRDTVEQLQQDLHEQVAVSDLEQVQDHVNTLGEELANIEVEKADKTVVEKYAQRLDANKADTDELDAHIDALSDDIRNVRHWAEDAWDTLESRITAVDEAAARADTVDEIQETLDNLQAAIAQQDNVQDWLDAIRDELDTLQEETITQDQLQDTRDRVQQLREQVGTGNVRERLQTVDRLESQVDSMLEDRAGPVSRDEFKRLYEEVTELSGLVVELLNTDDTPAGK